MNYGMKIYKFNIILYKLYPLIVLNSIKNDIFLSM